MSNDRLSLLALMSIKINSEDPVTKFTEKNSRKVSLLCSGVSRETAPRAKTITRAVLTLHFFIKFKWPYNLTQIDNKTSYFANRR